MPLNKNLKKVMVIGSGPIVIGQAAEFDYAGTQACRALKQAGLEVVLVNSNPATIMTDNAMADEISSNLEAMMGPADDTAPKAEPRHPSNDTTSRKFDNLQFGRNYPHT